MTRQRSPYEFEPRYGTIRGRFYPPGAGRLARRTLGTFAEFALDAAGRELPLPAAEREALREELERRWLAAEARLREEAARVVGRGRALEEIAEEFFRSREPTQWARDAERMLRKDVLPALGRRGVRDLRRREIAAVIEAVAARGAPIAARRTYAALRRLLNWALARDELEANPCTRIELPGRERSRERVLSAAEIQVFWRGIDRAPMALGTRDALRLILVTAQRPGEVRRVEWSEIDQAEAVWTIPAAKAKNRRGHRVPLSRLALDLLVRQPRGTAAVFPGRSSAPIARTTLINSLRAALPVLGLSDVHPHDLRRTAASHMARLGVPRLVIGRVLNHAERGVTAVYDRHAYEAETRVALDGWASELSRLVAPIVAHSSRRRAQ